MYQTSQQGKRPTNEDAHYVMKNFDGHDASKNPVDLYIICDGHGGDYVSHAVISNIVKYLTAREKPYPLAKRYIEKLFDHVQNKLEQDRHERALECGSAAIIVAKYMDDQRHICLQTINLGDCRAVISKNGTAMALTKDHKPYWPDEKRRIARVNAQIHQQDIVDPVFTEFDWRVNGLSVTRAFGDINAKPQISHIPDIAIYDVTDADFIVIACDGLWDVMQNHDAVNFVTDHIKNNEKFNYRIRGEYPTQQDIDTPCIATKLANYAIALGSNDNISVIIDII